MQPKFSSRSTIGQTLTRRIIKFFGVCLVLTFIVFLLDKINFPHPNKNIKKEITNEIIKLK
jgi:hypothetical protein